MIVNTPYTLFRVSFCVIITGSRSKGSIGLQNNRLFFLKSVLNNAKGQREIFAECASEFHMPFVFALSPVFLFDCSRVLRLRKKSCFAILSSTIFLRAPVARFWKENFVCINPGLNLIIL